MYNSYSSSPQLMRSAGVCDAIAESCWSVGLCRRQDNRTDLETHHMQPCCYSYCPVFHTCTCISLFIIIIIIFKFISVHVKYSTVWYGVVDIRAA